MKINLSSAIALSAALFLNACATRDLQTPAIQITSPSAGAIVELAEDDYKSLDIGFAAIGFEVKAAGQCGNRKNCGHVHVQIDPHDASCNYPNKPGNNTNAAQGGPTIKALFSLCPKPTGPHIVKVSLAYDDHSPVLVDGKLVSDSVRIVTRDKSGSAAGR